MMHAQDAVDLVVGRRGGLIQQVFGSHDDARRAKSALQTSPSDKAIHKGFALFIAEAFEREDALSCGVLGGHRTRDDRAIVNNNRAASALPLRAATVFRRNQTAPVAQRFKK